MFHHLRRLDEEETLLHGEEPRSPGRKAEKEEQLSILQVFKDEHNYKAAIAVIMIMLAQQFSGEF